MSGTARPFQIWIHASEAHLLRAAAVLSSAVTARRPEWCIRVTGPESIAIDSGAGADLGQPGLRLLVILGDRLIPTLIERASDRGLGLVLADCQAPDLAGLRRLVPGYRRALLRRFDRIFLRSESAGALTRGDMAGLPLAEVVGPLARHAPAPGCDEGTLDALRTDTGTRPVWVACALPEAEAADLVAAQAQVLRRAHRALLIVEPATPAAAVALRAESEAAGLTLIDLDETFEIPETAAIVLAPTDVERGVLLRLAPLCYVGGSLSKAADATVAEQATALGSALVVGPAPGDAAGPFLSALAEADALRRISHASDLGEAVAQVLLPEAGAALALRAWQLATDGSEATAQVSQAIVSWMDSHEEAAP